MARREAARGKCGARKGRGRNHGDLGVDLARHGAGCLVVVGVASSVDLEAWGVFKWGPRRYRYRGRRLRTGQLEVLTRSPYAARKRVGSRAQLWPRLAAACRLWDGHHRPPASALALLARALAVGLCGGVYEIFRQNTRCARGALNSEASFVRVVERKSPR